MVIPVRKMILAMGAPVCAIGVLVMISQGQLPEDSSPIRVQEDGLETTVNGPRVRLTLVNQTPKNVRGYVIAAEFLDSGGKVVSSTTHTRVHPPHLPHRGHSFAAGQSWNDEFKIPTEDGNPLQYKVATDYVLFEDGSSWGTDRHHQSFKIQGLLTGSQVERVRLQRLLSTGGAQAVVQDLQGTP